MPENETEILVRLGIIDTKVDYLIERRDDHERRLRRLEKALILGIPALLGIVAGVLKLTGV